MLNRPSLLILLLALLPACAETEVEPEYPPTRLNDNIDNAFRNLEQGHTGNSKRSIQLTIKKFRRRFRVCFKRYRNPGFYQMMVAIRPSGEAEVTPLRAPTRAENPRYYAFRNIPEGVEGGKDVGSPTNLCLADAIERIRFNRYEGPTMKTVYPIILR